MTRSPMPILARQRKLRIFRRQVDAHSHILFDQLDQNNPDIRGNGKETPDPPSQQHLRSGRRGEVQLTSLLSGKVGGNYYHSEYLRSD